MSRLKAFGAFWYDFIIGDDWQIAVVIAVALAVIAVLVHAARVDAWWLLPIAAIAVLGWSLRRATSGQS